MRECHARCKILVVFVAIENEHVMTISAFALHKSGVVSSCCETKMRQNDYQEHQGDADKGGKQREFDHHCAQPLARNMKHRPLVGNRYDLFAPREKRFTSSPKKV